MFSVENVAYSAIPQEKWGTPNGRVRRLYHEKLPARAGERDEKGLPQKTRCHITVLFIFIAVEILNLNYVLQVTCMQHNFLTNADIDEQYHKQGMFSTFSDTKCQFLGKGLTIGQGEPKWYKCVTSVQRLLTIKLVQKAIKALDSLSEHFSVHPLEA